MTVRANMAPFAATILVATATGALAVYELTLFGAHPAAAYAFPCLAAIIGGLVSKRLWIAWIGWAGLVFISLAFIFGSGGGFIPFSALLLVLLALCQTGHLWRSWLLLLIFLAIGAAINFPFAVQVLAGGCLLMLLLTVVEKTQKKGG